MANLQHFPESFSLAKLKTVDELKCRIKDFLNGKDILELAEKKLIPHYILIHPVTKKEQVYFITSEVNDWYQQHYIRREDHFYEQSITILSFDYNAYKIRENDCVPAELSRIRHLFKLPSHEVSIPPVIYFLCKNNRIVYIGQSIKLHTRISDHKKENLKDFDNVYFFPCKFDCLNSTELSLIKHFKPPLNDKIGNTGGKDALILSSLFDTENVPFSIPL